MRKQTPPHKKLARQFSKDCIFGNHLLDAMKFVFEEAVQYTFWVTDVRMEYATFTKEEQQEFREELMEAITKQVGKKFRQVSKMKKEQVAKGVTKDFSSFSNKFN